MSALFFHFSTSELLRVTKIFTARLILSNTVCLPPQRSGIESSCVTKPHCSPDKLAELNQEEYPASQLYRLHSVATPEDMSG